MFSVAPSQRCTLMHQLLTANRPARLQPLNYPQQIHRPSASRWQMPPWEQLWPGPDQTGAQHLSPPEVPPPNLRLAAQTWAFRWERHRGSRDRGGNQKPLKKNLQSAFQVPDEDDRRVSDPFIESGLRLSPTAAEARQKFLASRNKKRAPPMDWSKRQEVFGNF